MFLTMVPTIYQTMKITTSKMYGRKNKVKWNNVNKKVRVQPMMM